MRGSATPTFTSIRRDDRYSTRVNHATVRPSARRGQRRHLDDWLEAERQLPRPHSRGGSASGGLGIPGGSSRLLGGESGDTTRASTNLNTRDPVRIAASYLFDVAQAVDLPGLKCISARERPRPELGERRRGRRFQYAAHSSWKGRTGSGRHRRLPRPAVLRLRRYSRSVVRPFSDHGPVGLGRR